jgi:hypothetical protein
VYGDAINLGSGNTYGGYFYASWSGTGTHYGVYGEEQAGGSGAAIYAAGDLDASGLKSAVVRTSSGHRLLYAQESPEVWFEDFGEGQLSNGRAYIELDQVFLETVTIEKSNTGFDVYEFQGGTSDAVFSYRVVAKRKGYEDERLRVTDVGYEDPTLYPELLSKREREHEERLQRLQKENQERERQRQQLIAERQLKEEERRRRQAGRERMEEQRQQIKEQQRQMEQARLREVRR